MSQDNGHNVSKVIAIDGPSGSGKSTMAKKLASQLSLIYIDTGAMYRSVAYISHSKKVDLTQLNDDELKSFLQSLNIEYFGREEKLIEINGEDLTHVIREHHISELASIVSQLPLVREFLITFQRSLAKEKVCVMEGRDIATVVFPNAFCKLFVTANVEVRAKRRFDQLKNQKNIDFETVLKDVKKRDLVDTQRTVSPLKQAEGAINVDTSTMTEKEVLNKLVTLCHEQAKIYHISL